MFASKSLLVACSALIAGVFLAGSLAAQSPRAAATPDSAGGLSPGDRGDWNAVERFAWEVLDEKKKYERDDLITSNDVEVVLAQLGGAGWDVPQQDKLLTRAVPASDTLARLLSSKQGVKFMRAVSNRKGIYDQLDRLLQLPGGDNMVRDMITAHNGVQLVDYYFNHANRGINLTELLPRRGDGQPATDKDFRKPTGRIYTGGSLIEHLRVIYEAQLEAIEIAKAEAALAEAEQQAGN